VVSSLVESPKASGLEPYHHLRYLFTKILEMKPDDECPGSGRFPR
jgi:hypothetical protein